MKLWSPRRDTKASRLPSGAQVSPSFVPRVKNNCAAGFEPSSGTAQTWLPRRNASRSPRGEIAGSSPSTSNRGAPPLSTATAQIPTLGCSGLEA